MAASPQAESFQVRTSLDPLGPVSTAHGVFSNKDIRQPFGGNNGQ